MRTSSRCDILLIESSTISLSHCNFYTVLHTTIQGSSIGTGKKPLRLSMIFLMPRLPAKPVGYLLITVSVLQFNKPFRCHRTNPLCQGCVNV